MRSTKRRLVALGVTAVLVAAACGGDDDDGAESSGSDPAGTLTGEEASATTQSDAATTDEVPDSVEGTEPATSDSATTTPATTGDEEAGGDSLPLPAGERHVEEDEGTPEHGGTLLYGIEADTANPLAPYRSSTASSGHIWMDSVSDPLFGSAPDGAAAPMLIDEYTPNDDFTEWTLHVRDGIQFHDGTPLDAEAVKFNLEACKYSPLVAAEYPWIGAMEASGQDLTITIEGGPWAALPKPLQHRQCSYMFSPTWLRSLSDIPHRNPDYAIYDAELAATPANGDPAAPIGVGAFRFESYTPGNGNSFRLVRNDDYWRGENGVTGEELPYLDAIEGVVAVDVNTRATGLRGGEFDVMHTSNADTVAQFLDDDGFETTATSKFTPTNQILLSVAEGEDDPDGINAASPLLNVHCRRALAHALDQDRYIEERSAGLTLASNGPFGPGAMGYLEDSGYPQFDLDLAAEEMEVCLSELGTDRIELSFDTNTDPFNIESNQLISAMWSDAFGDQVTVTTTAREAGQQIAVQLSGTFNALFSRQYGVSDPEVSRPYLASSSITPVGQISINFGRVRDTRVDEQLGIIHSESEPDVRRAAAEELTRIFGEQVYAMWLDRTLWSVISQPYVNGVDTNRLPDGEEGLGLAHEGRHQPNRLWCDGGACE